MIRHRRSSVSNSNKKLILKKGILVPSCSTFAPFKNINGERIYLTSKINKDNNPKFKIGKANYNKEQINRLLSNLKRSITKSNKNK